MKYRDSFDRCHPAVNFLYFALVLGFTMFLMHPVSLAVSIVSAAVYAVQLNGAGAVKRSMKCLLPMALLAAVVNPAFNHAGVTFIMYLPGGNPLTLESILYGLAASGMLLAALLWFSCVTAVLTTDKFVYLFGRIAPALGLVLSMTVRFVPRFAARFREARAARRCLAPAGQEGLIARLRELAAVLSAMVSWSMENAMDTADSMKSRGWGLPGRTAYTVYRLTDRDRGLLLWLGLAGVFLLSCAASGAMDWRYYPTVRGSLTGVLPVSGQIVYLALCLTPVILNGWEAVQWKRLHSGI
ncbi:MAG: energy-coupling factor transporter transmembrane protein EcfT [Oscillospiraceae bacterium]|nr:energy-coupling factor transporter transmembrane protein EcfT [Oscillospiraceae bacterium]MDD6503794.1 energy-coupling factor transporter transmembrane component T [Oscillospiraceae bacterium]